MVNKIDILKKLYKCLKEINEVRDLIDKTWIEGKYSKSNLNKIRNKSIETKNKLDNLIDICKDLK